VHRDRSAGGRLTDLLQAVTDLRVRHEERTLEVPAVPLALRADVEHEGVRTHVVELGEATRLDNMATSPDLTTLDAVPTHGVTVGVSTIVDLSRSVVMVLTGPDKATAYARIVAADGYDPAWPSTAFAECADAQLFADRAAAGDPQTGR